MSATLAGSVTLEGGRKNLVIRFLISSTQTEVAKYIRALDATGAFTVTGITPDTYDIGVKCDGGLSLLATNQVFTEGNTTTIAFGTLLQGDICDLTTISDKVDFLDSSLLSGNYNKLGACKTAGGTWLTGNWLMPDWPTAGGGEHSFVSVV